MYASPLLRAVETARAVAEPRGLTVGLVPELREFDFRRPGATYDEVLASIRETARRVREDPDPVLPGGERWSAARARFAGAIGEILARHAAPLVVAHGIANRAYLGPLLGVPDGSLLRIGQDHAAVNVVEFEAGQVAVRLVNGGPPTGIRPREPAPHPSRDSTG